MDQRELEILRPMMMEEHGWEMQRLKECNLQPVLERIRQCNESKDDERKAFGLFQLKKQARVEDT